MIDTKALREKVLDLAIRGKLVPQDPNDEPASVLLERIRAEKQQMVKDGKLKAKDIKNDTIIFKADDNLHYEQFQDGTVKCIQEEIPFDLPDGWVWCYLPQIAQSELGKTLDKAKNTGEYHPYIRSVNVLWGKLDLSDLKQMRFENSELDKYAIRKNDLLICEGGDVGRCCIWDKDYSILYQNAIHRVRFYNDINPEFYMYVLMLYEHKGILKRISNGVTIKHLTGKVLSRLPIPLPSLHDQNNIVQIIKFMLSQIDSIETIYNELSIDISIIKSKILDLAIRGKLVPQNPEDEPASVLLERIRAEKEEMMKQGKIKRDKKESVIFKGDDNSYYEKIGDTVTDITDEIPFEIADNWAFVRLEDVVDYEQPTPYIVNSTEYSDTYETPVLTAGKSFIIGYTNETFGIKNELPVIIFDDFTTDSKYVDFPFKVKSSAMKILNVNTKIADIKYIFYAMQLVECDSYNHKRYWISEFSKKIIPLPPLEEQQLIVDRIEHLYETLIL